MQKKMGELQPKIAELKEKYKDDQQKQSQEMMKLWKKHGVNPMSGCLPMLAQLPIFIALYRTVQSSIDLRGASFLWIDDLSLPDMTFFLPFSLPYIGNAVNVLPFVMMAISFIQMQQQKKYMPDPSQAQVMTIMTLMFPFILYHFQSGLVLYWTANSLTQWIQQKAMEHMGHAAPRGKLAAGASSNGDEEEEPEDEGPAPGPKRPVPPPRPKPRRKRAAK
jgi:YidC/Oxa1 family membrane protein insertase